MKTINTIVIKVGSSILTGGTTMLSEINLQRIVKHVAAFLSEKKKVVLVSSGAIACGLSHLHIQKRPSKLSELQAAAAIGQNILMQTYTQYFAEYGLKCAQILLTRDDFYERKRYVNVRNTMESLLNLGVVPIVNENDTVSVDEIKFGDNDTLSALVAAVVDADGLLILTDTEGLYDNFDAKNKKGDVIKKIDTITKEIEAIACGTDGASCVGGMSTKISAAKIATNIGIPVVLANGFKDELAISFTSDKCDGTLFSASGSLGSKKRWIAFGAKVKGKIIVDDGAQKALISKAASLLAPGIVDCFGEFAAQDVVDVADKDDAIFARGVVRFSHQQLQKIKGKKADKEVIHRNDLIILA